MPQKIHPWNTKNRPTVGLTCLSGRQISCSAELGARPIQAEPVHTRKDEALTGEHLAADKPCSMSAEEGWQKLLRRSASLAVAYVRDTARNCHLHCLTMN